MDSLSDQLKGKMNLIRLSLSPVQWCCLGNGMVTSLVSGSHIGVELLMTSMCFKRDHSPDMGITDIRSLIHINQNIRLAALCVFWIRGTNSLLAGMGRHFAWTRCHLCGCKCTHTHTHTHTHTRTYTYTTHTHTHTHIHNTHRQTHKRIHINTYTQMHTHMYTHTHTHA